MIINVPFTLLDAVTVEDDQTSDALTINLQWLAIQAIYTDSPVGSLEIQASLDGATWTSLGTSYTLAISEAGDALFPTLNATGYTYIRAVYTKTSGTGALTVLTNQQGY